MARPMTAPAPMTAPTILSTATEGIVRSQLEAAVATNTRRMHRAHWTHFERWCAENAVSSLPAAPESVAAYLATYTTELRVGTLEHRLASIALRHRAHGLPDPTKADLIRIQMRGIRRQRGVAPIQKSPPLVK